VGTMTLQKMPFVGRSTNRVARRAACAVRSRSRLSYSLGAQGLWLSAQPLTWHGYIRFPADRIHKAAVEALVPGVLELPSSEDSPTWDADGWVAGHHFETGRGRDHLRGKFGFRLPPSDEAAELLHTNSPLLIKVHYALWAFTIARTDGDPNSAVTLSLPELCDALGYARLANGAHRPESKRQAARAVELLCSLELDVRYDAPDGRSCRLSGPLWKPGPPPDGTRLGAWSTDPLWRAYNRRIGLADARLLQLRPDRDRWAICAGGYLAPLARMNGYRPLRVRVRTLLTRSGLLAAERRNPARMLEKLERALERLEEARIIGGWDWEAQAGREPDMDDASALASLGAAADGWMARILIIRWPDDLDVRAQRLTAARETHARRRSRRAA
jgi:hypothetical protein